MSLDHLRAYGLRECPNCKRILVCNSYYFPFLTKRVKLSHKWITIECEDSLCWDCEKRIPGDGRKLAMILEKRKLKEEEINAREELGLLE